MRGQRNLCQVGDKHGKLTIVKRWTELRPPKKTKETYLECKCECGKIIETKARYLTNQAKSSCGCIRHQSNNKHHGWKGFGEISGTFWNSIIKGAKKRNGREIDFRITIQYVWDLYLRQQGKCALTGVDIGFSYKNTRYGTEDNTASLDRIDSSLGYTEDNVQWVHKTINLIKMDLKEDEFIQWCKTISKYQENSNAF